MGKDEIGRNENNPPTDQAEIRIEIHIRLIPGNRGINSIDKRLLQINAPEKKRGTVREKF